MRHSALTCKVNQDHIDGEQEEGRYLKKHDNESKKRIQ